MCNQKLIQNPANCSLQTFIYASPSESRSDVHVVFTPDLAWTTSLGSCNADDWYSGTTPENKPGIQTALPHLETLDGQNRQSLAFSERGQLSQANSQFRVERMLRRNERPSRDSNRSTMNAGSLRTNFCVLWGDTSPTNTSDSNRGKNSR